MILYRLIMALALPVMLLATLTGRWPKGAWRERLGLVPVSGAQWWVHGASLGELASARAVIAGLAAQGPVHVTTNSATGRALVAGWDMAGVSVSLAPFDTAGAAARLLARLQPRALIVIENEFWPARFAAARAAGVPVMVVGARMSDRSAGRWRIAGGMMADMLAGVAYLSAQDAASEARLTALGLPAAALGQRMNLKAGVVPVAAPADGPLPRGRTMLAASTHPGEEALILQAFMANRATFDHLIIAPRHATRGDEVARLITAQGLPIARRSTGASPQPGQPVFLADTLGEMDLWYAMAGVTVIGGSFAGLGGHTPFEPAAHGSALMCGPSVHNFTEVFAALDAADACIRVADGAGLTAALGTMSLPEQARLAANARAALAGGLDVAGLVAELVARA
ncbi:MAG: 3-deoxy-D-manno-octulosonic acid transferase [Paracoccaceae bacterium]